MDMVDIQKRIQAVVKSTGFDRTIAWNQVGSTVGSPGEGMQKRLREMFAAVLPDFDCSRLLVMDVGDFVRAAQGSGYDVGLSLPVASDIWYLSIGASILPFDGEEYQANADRILSFLEMYLRRLDNIKTLKSIHSYKDLLGVHYFSPTKGNWDKAYGRRIIRETRFETWMLNRNTQFPSKGPKPLSAEGVTKKPETSMGELYCGFLSFPVGPLGVMEVTSIFSESMYDMLKDEIPFAADGSIKIENPTEWKCVTDQPLDGFMSPMTDMKGECPGVHLVDKGYLIENRDAEYPAEPLEGYDKILPFNSMRFYLRRDAKWPLPGEFIGLLAKPWPSHVWWFQETSPLLYSGNWFETNHYTSGVVQEVLTIPEGFCGRAYRCIVRGVSVCISASDFCEYAMGERVAIIRLNDLDRFMDKTKGNFKWKEMDNLIAREKMEKETPSNLPYIVNPNMMIVPMSFYKT